MFAPKIRNSVRILALTERASAERTENNELREYATNICWIRATFSSPNEFPAHTLLLRLPLARESAQQTVFHIPQIELSYQGID